MMMEGGQGPREKLGFFSGAHSGGIGGRGGRDKDDSLSSSPSLTPSPPAPPSLTVAPGPAPAPVMGMAGISSGSGSSSGSGEDEKVGKKRWRPTEGGGHGIGIGGYGSASAAATASISLSLSSAPPPAAATSAAIAMTKPLSFDVSSSSSVHKRTRGRPPGSGRRQLLSTFGEWFAYSAGGNFTPHVVTVAAGEDVAARIMSFSQKGPRTICILSANGTISNVTLRQPGSSGGTLTFEGRFELLSLSGSFSITEDGGVRSRTGGISVSLAGPDGRVVGGGVAGLLLAASPIQLVVGSFLPNTYKEHKRRTNPESSSFSPIPTSGLLTAAKPIAQVNPNDDCETPTSAVAAQNRHEEQKSTIGSANPTYYHSTGGWHGLQQSSTEHKPSPDINISLPAE